MPSSLVHNFNQKKVKQRPLVSILIPTYNQEKFISTAVESALAQQYENLEVIVSDDCSTDNTELVTAQFLHDKRFRHFKNNQNLGRVRNYKNGLENYARGEWVINLDGDDYFTNPFYIKNAIESLSAVETNDVVFVQGGHEVRDEEGNLTRTDLPAIKSPQQVMEGKDYFMHFHHFSHMATLFNRRKAVEIDFYRYDIYSSDIESFLRLALEGRVILTREIAGVWRQHGSNASRECAIQDLKKNVLQIEGPYNYAKEKKIFSDKELERWRSGLLKKFHQNLISIFLSSKNLKGYLPHVARSNPGIFFKFSTLRTIVATLVKRYSFPGQH